QRRLPQQLSSAVSAASGAAVLKRWRPFGWPAWDALDSGGSSNAAGGGGRAVVGEVAAECMNVRAEAGRKDRREKWYVG
ncbi:MULTISPECIES: hypothetical protein, partial [unclassified Streptomyces]|uniref:hypothetical protein n=1 Tax=unclassified Streptomyces TaxID=2593676 RepID=UPI00081F3B11